MRSYIVKRLMLLIPTFLLVTMIVFAMIRLIPGDIIDLMLAQMGEGGAGSYGKSWETVDRPMLEHALGLDVPIYVQYARWLENALHGDLGKSLWKGTSVSEEIINRLPVTLELGLIGIVTALAIAFPIGIYSAIRQDTGGDYIGRSFAILCIAVPGFWIGTLVMVFPAIWWNWSPPMMLIPFFEDPIGNLSMFVIPGVILGMSLAGVTMRMTRTMMLEVLRQDYIRTAWSKGLNEMTVVSKHALRNALIPIVTLVGLFIPTLIGGTVILEQIFCLPGVGRLLVDALIKRDYILVSGINVFLACFVLVINLLVDLTYDFLDPRVRYR